MGEHSSVEHGSKTGCGVGGSTVQIGPVTGSKLRFRRLKGFKVHDTQPHNTGVGHHLKICSNSSGSLSISKHTYIAPKRYKSTQQAAASGSATRYLEAVDIPQPIDNLPDEVDLSMLEDNPRQRTASDFPLQVWLEDREDFLSKFIFCFYRSRAFSIPK
ncbi:hypothetical protein JVT61DRAFT_9891 [Boletus reticuloceps]|uniref:Uncharacterized protein n=1 Tax=Boletus reticuloceps TaxID=495285 RepID=A0A8I2YFT0_9AGAM|nr:hypothetical protein JVT61DRAFT_9891 [Boletus reticuloceps]